MIPLGHSVGIIAPPRLLAGFPGYTGLLFALEKELGSSGKVDPWVGMHDLTVPIPGTHQA